MCSLRASLALALALGAADAAAVPLTSATIDLAVSKPFEHFWKRCVGSGHMASHSWTIQEWRRRFPATALSRNPRFRRHPTASSWHALSAAAASPGLAARRPAPAARPTAAAAASPGLSATFSADPRCPPARTVQRHAPPSYCLPPTTYLCALAWPGGSAERELTCVSSFPVAAFFQFQLLGTRSDWRAHLKLAHDECGFTGEQSNHPGQPTITTYHLSNHHGNHRSNHCSNHRSPPAPPHPHPPS